MIPAWPRCTLVVALSGGMDSVVLLHALVQLRKTLPQRRALRLRAVHVDHHLQSGSGEWRRQCARLSRSWRVAFKALDARIKLAAGVSLEAAARTARYALLGDDLRPGEYLLTAQHEDDQLETVLLQLFRGGGVAGLAGMYASGPLGQGRLLRPLLPLSRAQLLHYANLHKLQWSDDPSNADLRFDRNFLRARVLPALRERWPAAATTVSRSARHLADANWLIQHWAAVDLQALRRGEALDLAALCALQSPRQRAAVRRWLVERGCALPDEVHLGRVLTELPAARADAIPLVRWRGGEVRRYRGLLVVVPPLPDAVVALSWNWRRQPRLTLGPGLGTLWMRTSSAGCWSRSELPQTFSVSFRAGGERVAQGSRHRKLKELLRSQGVLPWMRSRMPLVAAAQQLWCVPGVWNRHSSAAPARQARLSIEWLDAPVWRLPQNGARGPANSGADGAFLLP